MREKEPKPIFEWVGNRVQELLMRLRKGESKYNGKEKIAEIIDEINNSDLLWSMLGSYQDAHEACKGKHEDETGPLFALMARMYIAGSLLKVPVIEDV